MVDVTKTDRELGKEIQDLLVFKKINTPWTGVDLPYTEQLSAVEKHMEEVLKLIGFDLQDDSMKETPKRVAKMLVLDKFWGLYPQNFPKVMLIENKMGYDNMLIERDIPVISCCEHHLESIMGKACVAYIPGEKVIGLSKLNRVVEYFSHRPQVQERLTQQILCSLQYVLKTENVAVSITATHNCVQCSGVGHVGCSTTTNCFGGVFIKSGEARNELLKFL